MTRDAVLKGHSGQHEEVGQEGTGGKGVLPHVALLSFPSAPLKQPWETSTLTCHPLSLFRFIQ